jgi:hypothetical protein
MLARHDEIAVACTSLGRGGGRHYCRLEADLKSWQAGGALL